MPLFILRACRTPWGALGGSHKALSAPQLAGAAMCGLLEGVDPGRVEGCILGMAIQAGAGPNPAREAARLGGLPPSVPAFTLNQGLASGLEAVAQGCLSPGGLVVAGGMESSSSAPYLLPSARWGTRMGAAPVLDALLQDAHWPPMDGDRERTLPEGGPFRLGIVGPGADDLPPPGRGPLPADGAALLLLGTQGQALPPRARVLAFARGQGAGEAAREALLMAGLPLERMDRFELDHPRVLPGLPPGSVNGGGGAASLGLAQGAEGARRLVALVHQLGQGTGRYGLAALEADGQGLALILERR